MPYQDVPESEVNKNKTYKQEAGDLERVTTLDQVSAASRESGVVPPRKQ